MSVICSLSSGSDGNSVLISDGKTHILIDAGISAKRISVTLRQWNLTLEDLSGVLVTHEHGDHIYGLHLDNIPKNPNAANVFRVKSPVYAAEKTCQALSRYSGELRPVGERPFEVGSLVVTPFHTPHDTPQSLGYLVHMGRFRVAVCTDLGHMPDDVLYIISTAHYLILEANHDVQMVKNGSYPRSLKDRILGPNGHLSNDACGKAVAVCARFGVRHVTLFHLSNENNSPDVALGTVAFHLHQAGFVPGQDVMLDVAPHGVCGIPHLLG